jgi:hypothetical protein
MTTDHDKWLKELPTEPGVYLFTGSVNDGSKHTTRAQLDYQGDWWPYPFTFSGWREAELMTYEEVRPMGLTPDNPWATPLIAAETTYRLRFEDLTTAMDAVNVAWKEVRKAEKQLRKARGSTKLDARTLEQAPRD